MRFSRRPTQYITALLTPFLLTVVLIVCPAGNAFDGASLTAQNQAFTPLPEERHRELISELNYLPPELEVEEKPVEPNSKDAREDSAFVKWLKSLFQTKKEVGPIELPTGLFYLILFVLVAICAYFIYSLLDERILGRFRKEEEARRVDVDEIEEEKLSFRQTESLLTRAEKNGQFAIAVRLQYLAVLKRLHEMELIRYQKDKVNRRYIFETATTPFGKAFRQLTEDFERNWYGDYPIDRLSYRLIAQKFAEFRNRLDHFEIGADA